MTFATTWIDLEIIILSKFEKGKYHQISLVYVLSKKKIQMTLFTEQKQTQFKKNSLKL